MKDDELQRLVAKIDGDICSLNVVLRTEADIPKRKKKIIKRINESNDKLQDVFRDKEEDEEKKSD